MNEKLRKIVNHYGIKKQLKYFQSEVFEMNEAILSKTNASGFDDAVDGIIRICSVISSGEYVDRKREHIKEEIADVMVMLKQFQLHYDISTEEIIEVMHKKVDRQIKRIEEENRNVK